MPSVEVVIHESQFPDRVRADLLASLRRREVNHKFHYDSVKQTQKWLALHEAYSPARRDADCTRTYDRAFAGAAEQLSTRHLHVIGLGCGGGQKDARLLARLARRGRTVSYTPCDVSTAMVLVARNVVAPIVPPERCRPVVCDLPAVDDLRGLLANRKPSLVTFFGMIPNFEPRQVLPKIAGLLRRDDRLLFSANLAPGDDYGRGMQIIRPQYDNRLTREWLGAFLFDLGVERTDGDIRFTIETGEHGLKRVIARFHFKRPRTIAVDSAQFRFRSGQSIRLFFSYRYTPALMRSVLERSGVAVLDQWITASGEEGVFFCRKK
jgi:L-histidine N-alpha-methyltransferase